LNPAQRWPVCVRYPVVFPVTIALDTSYVLLTRMYCGLQRGA
jgi:hypothetical protein